MTLEVLGGGWKSNDFMSNMQALNNAGAPG
jgi:hypothetical protein